MEALLVFWVIVRVLANAAEDLGNAARGRPRRPRLVEQMARSRKTGPKPDPKPDRYGARRYAADLWQDAWTDARAKRDAKRAAPKQPDPAATPTPAEKPTPAPVPAAKPAPTPGPQQPPNPAAGPAGAGRPALRLVPPPSLDLPDPATPAATGTPNASAVRCNRPVCVYGFIIGHRPWPGAAGSSPDADQLCDRCGWLSSHVTARTFDQRMAGPPGPAQTPDPATPPAGNTPDPATPPAGDTPTPAQPAGKDTTMPTTGEITSVQAARSFAEAMAKHNTDVMGEIEHAHASLASRGVSGPVVDQLSTVREYYAQAGARWDDLLKAIGQHEALAEAARNTQGAAKDMSFYTNA